MPRTSVLLRPAAICAVIGLAACGGPASDAPLPDETAPGAALEATSLLGEPLYPPAPAAEASARMLEQLAEARASYLRAPDDADAIIWLGRRTAYLGRYREAIDIYTDGIRTHPEDARLYRHRGHRYITVREFDNAIADLERAATLAAGQPDQVEPDGQPNARGIPTSTLHSNIHYHLALARYLTADYAGAADAWARARAAVDNPDNLVAASHWLYLSLRRAGLDGSEAVLEPIAADLDVIENASYHQLLLMYKGARTPEELLDAAGEGASASALLYGVSAWYLLEGRTAEAAALWKRLVAQPDWPSFGHIAAEAELARRVR